MAHHRNGEVQPPLQPELGLRPPPERYQPHLHRASTGPVTARIVSWDPMDVHPPAAILMREQGATQAYVVVNEPVAVGQHRHPKWGCVVFAVIYTAIDNNVFQAPRPRTERYVAIKRLNKRVVDDYLRRGGDENPYKEMARMEELGDNIHVLRHIEFLEDDEYLYIVTPKGSTLLEEIQWFDSENVMDARRSRMIFRKILKIIGYLDEHGINHHDFSPDNFLFLTPDNLVVFDLALSVRIPVDPVTGQRALIAPPGNFGTRAWMDPIVYSNVAYDGVAMDLWAAGVILYNLLTNQCLYERPDSTDISYDYFVRARGLSAMPMNAEAVALLRHIFEEHPHACQKLLAMATAHENVSPEAIELFENLFQVDPANRFSLAQAIESAYVQFMED